MANKYISEEKIAMMQAHINTAMDNLPRKRQSKTDLSYWFPLIEVAGIPVPKTKIISITESAKKMIWGLFDGQDVGTFDDPFFQQIKEAATEMGFPCFLRTDDTSGKHSWKETCFLPNAEAIPAHVAAIAEFSECADMLGLPWDTWAVREMLPTMPYGNCPSYGNMPVCKEFRFFVKDGKVTCWHPYWPLSALRDGGWAGEDISYNELCHLHNENELILLAERTGAVLGDAWSIDILETERGWFVTDLAEAHKSYHWEGCYVEG
jgi:hypothetical protein